MVQIAGKYQLEKNINFLEFLIKNEIPEEKAKKVVDSKPILTVTVDGDKITVDIDGLMQQTNEYTLNKEIDEVILTAKLKSTATLNDNVLTITSKGEQGKTGKRVYTFKDDEVEAKISSGGVEATRIYKRL